MSVRLRCELVTGSPPAAPVLPVSVARVKQHARIVSAVEDALLEMYVWAACQRVEGLTDYRLSLATYDGWVDAFPASPGILEIPLRPIVLVGGVRTYDASDVETVVDPAVYWTDLISDPGRIGLRSGQSWPTGLRDGNGGAVQFDAGYTTVPADLERLVAQLAAAYWLNRGAEPPELDQMITPWRRPVLA